jgi:hypothetical protein
MRLGLLCEEATMIRVNNLNTKELKKILLDTNGKIFSVSFIKKNGELRNMVARLNVKSRAINPDKPSTAMLDTSKPYILVFDFQKDNYRIVNYETIQSIKFKDTLYERSS